MTDRSKDASLEILRRADPLRGSSVVGWSTSLEADAILSRILDSVEPIDATPPQPRVGSRALRVVAIAAALVLAAALGAVAGELVGSPAPASVKRDLAGVDQGMPDDLRLNPDVESAVLAAYSKNAQLYFAALSDGGYCFEIVTEADGARGAVCTQAVDARSQAIEITMPFTEPVTRRSPIEVGGRVNVAATSLEARFADGRTTPVQLGANGFYLYEVQQAQIESAHVDGFDLIAYDAAGTSVGSATAPPTDFGDPGDMDRSMPIFISTISTEHDFTKVLGIEGSCCTSHKFDSATASRSVPMGRTTTTCPPAEWTISHLPRVSLLRSTRTGTSLRARPSRRSRIGTRAGNQDWANSPALPRGNSPCGA